MDEFDNFFGGGGDSFGGDGLGTDDITQLINMFGGFAGQGTSQIDQTNQFLRQSQLSGSQNVFGLLGQLGGSALSAGAQSLGPQLDYQKFQQVFPYMQQLMSSLLGLNTNGTQNGAANGGLLNAGIYQPGQNGNASTGASGSGGAGTAPPAINSNYVYTPQQIGQAVNQGISQNAQGTAGAMNQMRQMLGGAGYGANSQLGQALNAQLLGQQQGTNASLRSTIPMQYAQANQQGLFNSQVANSNQWQNIQQNLLARQGNAINAIGQVSSLLK